MKPVMSGPNPAITLGQAVTRLPRLFGPGRWLLLYVGCGVVGQAFGFRWQPYDAGASVAGAGLLRRCAPGCCRRPGRPWPASGSGGAWPLAGLVLTAVGDIHGPPLLLGFALGARLLWRDRKGCPGAPRSRRDRGAGTLLTGFALAALAGCTRRGCRG